MEKALNEQGLSLSPQDLSSQSTHFITKQKLNGRTFTKLFENFSYPITLTDKNNKIIFVNQAFTTLTGYEQEEVLGRSPNILYSGMHDALFYKKMWSAILQEGMWKGEIWNKKKNGELFLEEITISTLKNPKGKILHFVAMFKDITEIKRLENEIKFQAYHDDLTKLPNRKYLYPHLKSALISSKENNKRCAIIFLDLDRFKDINDNLGHRTGDELLKATADRLKDTIDQGDFISRFGGDEFVIHFNDVKDEKDIEERVNRLISIFELPFLLNDLELYVTPSIGISIYPDDGEDKETLIKRADSAMYHAKQQGRSTYRFYHKSYIEDTYNKLVLASDLRKAYKNDEFRVHYQPQFSLQTGKLTGLEALVRWNHPERGMISPGIFIPIAEETGLITHIDQWVLYQACHQNKRWQKKGLNPVKVAVNLSMLQFQQKNLFRIVESTLSKTGLDPCYLEIELTESIIMDNPQVALSNIQKLKSIGVQISMDDFGIHHSSLSYLKQLPIDRLKIDQLFVRDLIEKDDQVIVKAMIELAHNLNLIVVAEGVENEEQINFLKSKSCDDVQGFYYSQALPACEVERYL